MYSFLSLKSFIHLLWITCDFLLIKFHPNTTPIILDSKEQIGMPDPELTHSIECCMGRWAQCILEKSSSTQHGSQ